MVDVEKLIKEVRKYPVLYDQTSEKYKHSEYKEKIWNNISITLGIKDGVEECKKKWSSVRDQLRRTLQKRRSISAQARYREYKHESILGFLIPHVLERDTLSNGSNLGEHQDQDVEGKNTITDTQEEVSEQIFHLQNTRNINQDSESEFENQVTDSMDNSLQSITATSTNASSFSLEKDKFSRPAGSLKRKTYPEEKPLDISTSQLMAYVLEEHGKNKIMKTTVQNTVKHPVDAFLCGIAPTLKSLNPILLNQAKSRIFSVVQEFEMKQLIMSNQDQHVRDPSHFVSVSPTSQPQYVPTLSTITIPFPSPFSVETTNVNVRTG